MDVIEFEWDDNKNEINRKKHKISFEEAKTVLWNEVRNMKAEYDFTNAEKNPYAKKLKKQITINIDSDTIDYFKAQADNSGIPYQTLINLYLADCAVNKKQLQVSWR